MAQQTAIDWLIDNLPNRFYNAIMNECSDLFEEAKKMEKEHIVDAFDMGCRDENRIGSEYYNEIYKS